MHSHNLRSTVVVAVSLGLALSCGPLSAQDRPLPQSPTLSPADEERLREAHNEQPDDAFVDVTSLPRLTEPARLWRRGGFVSVQVNVDALGNNIVGDAANEPSIAVDLTDSSRLAIGWRQFDTISNNFRQAGFGNSADGGVTWTAGVIEAGTFRSDPVLDSDGDGNFYYNSLSVPGGTFTCDVFRSSDGGASWDAGVFAAGGDKQWMAIDRRLAGAEGTLETGPPPGAGHVYSNWNQSFSCCGATGFVRSVDGGDSYGTPISTPQQPFWGTTAVGPEGEVYVVGRNGSGQIVVAKSTTLRDPAEPAAFDSSTVVDLGGTMRSSTGPNPGGLLGQAWVAVDTSDGPRSGWVYVLVSVDPTGSDPLDVHMVRSQDGGATWSAPVKVNQEAEGADAWQWFGTLSVAPNGRLDAIWNDTRNDQPGGIDSELTYAYSTDGGVSWSSSQTVSPSFDPHLGWPQQSKIGDYYDMVSENDVVHVAYAATFNGEQDVYYLAIDQTAFVFDDGFESGSVDAWSVSMP